MEIKDVVSKLIEKKITIGSIESLTGGLFASTISGVSGVSAIYKGSIVSYSTLIKENVLKIEHQLVEKVGVVSNEVAYLMAKNGKEILDVDIAISFTGNAGPSVMENKPVGLVYIGLAYGDDISTFECHFEGTRDEIRLKCVNKAFEIIEDKIKN